MPDPQINYFKSRKGYYTQFKNQQRLLARGPKDEPSGPTYQAAVKRFAEIMHLAKADKADNTNLVCIITAKAIGRQVKNFDDKVWTEHCRRLVTEGNVAKFSQNEALRVFLLGIDNQVLVEARREEFVVS